MNSSDDPGRDAEEARVGRIYGRYGASLRRRRAWAADNPGNIAIREELLRHLLRLAGPLLEGDGNVLDAGCGTGHWLRELAKRGVDPSRLHGIDILPARLDDLARNGFVTRVADVRRLPYADDSFELVLLFTVLSSLDSRLAMEAAIREAHRVLAPGGLLLSWEPRLPNPFNNATRRVSQRTFKSLGEPVDDITVTVVPPLARRLGRRTNVLYPLLARIPPLRTHRLVAYRENATS